MRRGISAGISWLAVVLAFGLLVPALRAEEVPLGASAKIEAARERGEIDREAALMYGVFAVVAPERLPAPYRADEGALEKCGAEAVRKAQAARDLLSPANRDLLSQLLARPSTQTYANTTHYRIHFDTSGTHAVLGWPDETYLHAVEASVESTYYVEHVVMPFDIPPDDGGLGGDSRTDCYVRDLGTLYYGYAVAEGPGPGPENDWYGYFVIDNDYVGFGYPDPADPARVTIAHEYFHLVQYGYDASEGVWAMETGAAWVEDEVYDDIDDNLQYLGEFFSTPYKRLTSVEGYREYGAWVWLRYLSENFGADIVEVFWDGAMTTNYFSAMQDELVDLLTSLDEELEIFVLWKFLCRGNFAPGHFEEGESYPTTLPRNHSTYPVSDSPGNPPDRLACNYIAFNNNGDGDTLRIGFSGPTCMAVRLITKDTDGVFVDSWVMPLSAGEGTLDIPDWRLYSKAIMVPTTHNDCPYSGNTYSYTAELIDASTAVALGEVERAPGTWLGSARPSPCNPATTLSFRLGVEGGVRLSVYDSRGRLVRVLLDDRLPAGEHRVRWDGRDAAGRPAASGIYLCRLETADARQTRKLILAR